METGRGVKTLLMRLALAMLFPVFSVLVTAGTGEAWLSGWQYRWAITVTERSGANLYSHQVGEISVQGNNLLASNYVDFTWFKSGGTDVRFADVDGVTQLSFWRSSWDDTAKTASLWVKLPILEANQIHTIYLYGGNSIAADASNYDKVMVKLTDTNVNSCVGLWHMDEGSGQLTDYSGNGRPGTLNGGTTWVTSSDGGQGGGTDQKFASGNYLSFNGNGSYVGFGDITDYDFQGQFTAEGWFYVNDFPSGSDTCQRRYPLISNMLWGWVSQIDIDHRLTICRYASSSSAYGVSSTTPLQTGKWYHYAMVQEANSLKLYLNGALEGSTPTATLTTYYVSDDVPTIGRTRCGSYNYYFKGLMDEVAIYNRALSQAEIQAHYNRRKYANPQPTWMMVVGEKETYNHPPSTPYNVFPQSGATRISCVPLLQSSAFYDTDNDVFRASQWQISTASGTGFEANIVYNSGATADPTSHTITIPLSMTTTYYWRVRHQDYLGAWSGYSAETPFTTAGPGESWLSGWQHRWPVTIWESSGATLTNHQVGEISIQGNDPLASNYVDFAWFKSGGTDVRFADVDGVTQLSFWRSSWDDTAKTAQLWVKVPTLEANQSHTIYLYGSNSNAVDTSSYDNTFTKISDTTAQGCVGLWHMDNGSGDTITDSSGNGYDATRGGTKPVWQSSDGGQWGNVTGQIFNTGSYLLFNNNYAITNFTYASYSTGITMEAWVKTSSATNSYITDNGGGSGVYNGTDLYMQSGRFYVYASKGISGNANFILDSGITINDNTWHHIAFTWDGTTNANGAKTYIDGQPGNTATATATITAASYPFSFATYWGLNNYYWNGSMDEVAIYNRPLSQTEIQAHFYRRKYANPQPSWTFSANPERVWYKDADNDGYSDGTILIQSSRPTGYKLAEELISTSGDCDDTNAAIHPGTVWYKDADGDGYSDGITLTQCARPTGYKLASELTATSGDCDDTNAAINPATVWYRDIDNDGYPDGPTLVQCARPTGYKLAGELTSLTLDNCPNVYNPDQRDSNWDGVGDACSTIGSASDLALEMGDISFYGQNGVATINPNPGDTVTIKANVHNIGSLASGNNIAVKFFYDAESAPIGSTNIAAISANGSGIAQVNWTAPGQAGYHVIKVVVAQDIHESYTANNTATHFVVVGSPVAGNARISLAGGISPTSTYPGGWVTVYGQAEYVWSNGTRLPVLGANIDIIVPGQIGKWNTYTVTYGNYSRIINAPLLPGSNYKVRVTVSDSTLTSSLDSTLIVSNTCSKDLTAFSDELSPGDGTVGESEVLKAYIHNVGYNSVISSFKARYEVANPTGSVIYSATRTLSGVGAQSGVLQEFGNWTPSGVGTYTLKVTIDPDNTVTSECSKDNNVVARHIHVYPAYADLTPAQVTLNDRKTRASICSGDAVTLTADILNVGGYDSNPTQVHFYVNNNQIGSVNIGQVTKRDRNTTYASLSWTPSGPGIYNVCVLIDAAQANDQITNNNQVCATLELTAGTASPDLQVNRISHPTLYIGATSIFTAQIQNVGCNASSTGTLVAFTVNGSSIGQPVIASLAHNGITTAGAQYTFQTAGDYQVCATVDDPLDSHSANDSRCETVTVNPFLPDLTVKSEDIYFSNPNPKPGEEIVVQATIHNIGAAASNEYQIVFYENETLPLAVKTVTVPLSPNNSYVTSIRWTPVEAATTYVMMVAVSPITPNHDPDYTNNEATRAITTKCDPRPITGSVSPSTATLWPPDGRMVPVTIDISNLVTHNPNTQVRIASVTATEYTDQQAAQAYGNGPQGQNPDIEITGSLSLNLRAERQDISQGRTYTIVVAASDCSGSTTSATGCTEGNYYFTTQVTVPHD